MSRCSWMATFHIFSEILRIFWNYCYSYRAGNSEEEREEEILPAFVGTRAVRWDININHYWKGIQISLPFTSNRLCWKLYGNAWLPISFILPVQERWGHVGLHTSWSFFDLLGYFAAHCPAAENHDGTGLVIGMLFSQVPWEKKRCVNPMKRERRVRLNLSWYRIYS